MFSADFLIILTKGTGFGFLTHITFVFGKLFYNQILVFKTYFCHMFCTQNLLIAFSLSLYFFEHFFHFKTLVRSSSFIFILRSKTVRKCIEKYIKES